MATNVRKIEIREANQARILEAAEIVFAKAGVKGATVEQIARQAELPKANVHYYFKTKQNIYEHVLGRVLDEWMVASATFDTHGEPGEVLRSYVTAKMAYSRRHPCGSKVWASEIMSDAPVMDKFLGTNLKVWHDHNVAIIRSWIRKKKIKPIEPRALLYMIWATTQHYADFERQVTALNGGKKLTDRQYRRRTEDVTRLILQSVGLEA